MALRISASDGFPAELYLPGQDTVIQFVERNSVTRQVTWQVLDEQGAVVSGPRTDVAPPEFFTAVSPPGFRRLRDNQPPSLPSSLYTVGKATIGLMAVAGTNAGSRTSVIMDTVGIMTTPIGVASDLGVKQHAIVNGAVWGVNAAQCASMFAQVAAYSSNPLLVPGWAVLLPQIGSGAMACGDTVEPIVGTLRDSAIQNLEARQKVAEFLRLADLAMSGAGMPADYQPTGGSLGNWTRRDVYFQRMNLALAMITSAESTINTEFTLIGEIDRLAVTSALIDMLRAFTTNIQQQKTNMATLLAGFQSSAADIEGAIHVYESECASSGRQAACDAIPPLRLLATEVAAHIEVFQGVIKSLELLPGGQ